MNNTNLVRPSRDGDQFHYLWAARRALSLLLPDSGLTAITIEGASPSESKDGTPITAGEQVIDIAEYYGSEVIEQAERVCYMQLKHSSLHATKLWTASGVEKTLRGFAERYREILQKTNGKALSKKLEFWFVTNRPIQRDFSDAVDDIANGHPARHPAEHDKLKHFTSLDGAQLREFCQAIRLDGNQDGYWEQRNLLFQDLSKYLPDADVDLPTQLKELVTRKALTESEDNPVITKMDVLRVLKTDESRLFPAPCLIEEIADVVPREQEAELVDAVVAAGSVPIIIHADGGVGKSIFATRIKYHLPVGSQSIVYDCFGNGQYRSTTGLRHRHRDGLVQIANELAAKGLCHPLIPTPNADHAAYLRAFMFRLGQCVAKLKASHPDAVLCIIIDAADNAQMAAEEIGEAKSFPRDLLREKVPNGVRLVFFARSHRVTKLDPPLQKLSLELKSFSRNETAVLLREKFPSASEHDVNEFHRLSSQNPRVQALALAPGTPLDQVLRSLGPNPTTVESAIAHLLQASIARLRDAVGSVEKQQIDMICSGLAALRPLIPISVLSAISGVDEAAIRSFAFDLCRPLIVTGEKIQFFDEPAETWFRDQFRPSASALADFTAKLKPLASQSAYVAAALPQLMLEAGQLAELVTLALSSDGLPETSPVERRDVELQRLQFAFKAALRARRYPDAAMVALKAGGESAGDARQRKLIQSNTDMAAVFLDANAVQEAVSRRTFGAGWVGSHHAYEAALMSGHEALVGEARSRLRMAEEWLRNWSQLSSEERRKEEVSDLDRANMTMAHLNIHGPSQAAHSLRIWRPRELSFRAGRIVARRLADGGRYKDLDLLAIAAGNDLSLILAIALEATDAGQRLSEEPVRRAIGLLADRRVKVENPNAFDTEEPALRGVVALVECAIKVGATDNATAHAILSRYLPQDPPRGLSSRYGGARFPFLRAYALRAALAGIPLGLDELAYPELKKQLEAKERHHESRELQEFKEDIGALLPWHVLWAKAFLGGVPRAEAAERIEEARKASNASAQINYREESHTADEIAGLWLDILLHTGAADPTRMDEFAGWVDGLRRPLYTPTLTRIARLAARHKSIEAYALVYGARTFTILKNARMDAEQKSDAYIDLARAILVLSPSEAAAYFNEAVEVADKIGDENLARWDALLDLADRSARSDQVAPEVAYKFSRCAELTYEYVDRDKHFNWEGTVRSLVGLGPSSAFTILSRWRDRNFGRVARLLPEAIEACVTHGALDVRDAVPLFPFRADWEPIALLEWLLKGNGSRDEQLAGVTFVHRYMTLEGQNAKTWRGLKTLLLQEGFAVPDDLDELIAFAEKKESSKERRNQQIDLEIPTGTSSLVREEPRDWDEVFKDCDVAVGKDLSVAYQRFCHGNPPFYASEFFRQALVRLPVGKEPDFIVAVSNVNEFDLYELRNLLETIPQQWKARPSIKRALGETVRAFCRKYCMQVSKNRYYEIFPFGLACELSGLEESQIAESVLTAIAESTEIPGAGRLFSLVGIMAAKLSPDEALAVLTFGLSLFDTVLEHKDGDGAWSTSLQPPEDTESAIAGYVWAALASPVAALRWEAAHVVVGICLLNRAKLLAALIELAKNGGGGPFVHQKLVFYLFHAREWLLIGLARAAKEAAQALVVHAQYLLDEALNGTEHVMIRAFATRALLELQTKKALMLEEATQVQLSNVNVSPFAPVVVDRSAEFDVADGPIDQGTADTDRYYFGIDMGPYWFAPLGRCFSRSQAYIEGEALRVIRTDWKYGGSSRWDEDERMRRRTFREQSTYHRHSSYPRIDDLRFYHSYHAMMIVAGRLLASVPARTSSDELIDRFADWMSRHDISRPDGRWLADRRDAVPWEHPPWVDEADQTDWRWSIRRSDFERALEDPAGNLNVWGRWNVVEGAQEESVHVRSALVGHDRSEALLRALQTAANPYDYRIPNSDDEDVIEGEGFHLKPWVFSRTMDRGLDEQDLWAGDVSFSATGAIERGRCLEEAGIRRGFADLARGG